MAHLITFRSSQFDIPAEPPHPVNPIAGESVLRWLRGQLLMRDFAVTDVAAEDWGWYVEVTLGEAVYLVGLSAEPAYGNTVECKVQIERHRAFMDRLTGAGKMSVDDPLSTAIESIIRNVPDASRVEVQRAA